MISDVSNAQMHSLFTTGFSRKHKKENSKSCQNVVRNHFFCMTTTLIESCHVEMTTLSCQSYDRVWSESRQKVVREKLWEVVITKWLPRGCQDTYRLSQCCHNMLKKIVIKMLLGSHNVRGWIVLRFSVNKSVIVTIQRWSVRQTFDNFTDSLTTSW